MHGSFAHYGRRGRDDFPLADSPQYGAGLDVDECGQDSEEYADDGSADASADDGDADGSDGDVGDLCGEGNDDKAD